VVGDLGNLSKEFKKQDLIVILRRPRNSLDRNYLYLIGKKHKFIYRRQLILMWDLSNLLVRHDKSWINRRVRRVNLRLDWAMMGRDMPHTAVTDTASIIRENYTSHGPHLNSCGKRTLESHCRKYGDNPVISVSSITIFTLAVSSLF
jgi:hypothetical protein